MGDPRGHEIALELVRKSDIVIDNFSARVMRQWGMDYQSLSRVKPDIICVSMSGFGHTGPRSNFVSYGPTLQALTGYTRLMTDVDGEPAGYGYSYSDMAGGFTGALAALAALWNRRRTGRGQFVDLSQLEAVAALVGPSLLDITVNGREQQPRCWESQEAPAAPHGVYRCGALDGDDDRWVAIAVRSDSEWRRFVEALGSPAWASEPKFRTLYLRMRNREELEANISRWTAARSAEDAMAALQRAHVPAGVVSNGADICERDRQLKARGFWPAVARADGSPSQVSGVPFRLSGGSGSVRTIAPDVGENNDYILGELLGMSPAKREELIAAGVVWP
jgi:crotonobetainyl-CoA:carnitine CoA-transferase CaiB-like acyl-CoA transferase